MVDSVRMRLTLWYVTVLALVLITFSIGIYTLLSRSLYERVDDSLRAIMQVAIKSLIHDTEEGQTRQGAAESTVTELFNPQQALAIFDGVGRLLAKNTSDDGLPVRLPDLSLVPHDELSLFTVAEEDDDDDMHRLAVQRVSIPPAHTPYIILASQPLDMVEDELESLQDILSYGVPIALILAGLGGWFLARKSLAPVVAMAEEARRIGATNLDHRLPVVNPRDEMGRLATSFNELLARLSDAFAHQRRFMADASHELRTPLSVVHTAADVTLDQPHREESEYREAIKMMHDQIRRLIRIVEDMFTLARADAGRYPLRQRRFYLDELIEETTRAANILAISKNVNIDIGACPEALFYGDEDLVRQMLLNLLDNAIKHTPPDGSIRLHLTRERETYFIAISDTGQGIPADAQPHVFERFYRADKAHSCSEVANGGGAGLGLAISRWIAEAHKGHLKLARSDRNGTTFVAMLPAYPSD